MDKKENIIILDMAEAGYESMYTEKWKDLHPNSIERALWIQVTKKMLRAVKFPGELYLLCRDLHLKGVDENG